MTAPLLEVKEICPVFKTEQGKLSVAEKVSFTIDAGQTVGLVGESGCGKSVTALSIMGLLPPKTASVESGEILFNGQDLLQHNSTKLKKITGSRIAMIFQEPMTCLNPVLKVGKQIEEVLWTHERMDKKSRKARVIELLNQVGIDAPNKRVRSYPHQLSGGMRQRVMIAMALACRPELLIADEPTTALDVTIQAQILDLIKNISQAEKMAVLMITHDLSVIAQTAQKVIVMYAGRIVEQGPVRELLKDPLHPYTQGLLKSVPRTRKNGEPLFTIKGTVPGMHDLIQGCRFNTRCHKCHPICRIQSPELRAIDTARSLNCWQGTEPYEQG